MNTPDILNQIPELATEVWITWDHPNPSLTAERTSQTPNGQPPTRLDVWDTLRPDTKGDLALLHGWCITIDDVSDETLPPIPEDTPTWTGVCRYLTETWSWWRNHPLTDDCNREIRDVHKRLRMLARTPAEPRYVCPKCRARAHMRDNGSWMLCEADHVIDHHAEIARAMSIRPPMTVGQIAAELGEKTETIKKWIDRHQIVPERRERGRRLFDLERVRRSRVA